MIVYYGEQTVAALGSNSLTLKALLSLSEMNKEAVDFFSSSRGGLYISHLMWPGEAIMELLGRLCMASLSAGIAFLLARADVGLATLRSSRASSPLGGTLQSHWKHLFPPDARHL
jgi:hypothetical protein